MPKAKCLELSDQVIIVDDQPRFQIGNYLGRGSFGVTHLGFDLKYNKRVVIKAESSSENIQLLRLEYEVYKALFYAKSLTEVPKMYKFLVKYQVDCLIDGATSKLACNLLVMDQLGLDLHDCAAFARVVGFNILKIIFNLLKASQTQDKRRPLSHAYSHRVSLPRPAVSSMCQFARRQLAPS